MHGQMSKSRGAWLSKYTPMAIMAMSRYAKIQHLHKRSLVLSLIYVSNVIINVCLMYGHVIQGSKPFAHNDGRTYKAGSSHSDDPTEVHHGTTTLLLHKQT